MDRIEIRDLTIPCRVGVTPAERRRPRPLVVSVSLLADLRAAAARDDIRQTVDYAALRDRIAVRAAARPCRLIERVAQRVVDCCLENPRVAAVRVTVFKPGALAGALGPAVTIVRRRSRP
jgi:dihydroneopterin aldolase